jgi:hypothetical protein
LRPGEDVYGQFGGAFEIRYTKRDDRGIEVEREVVLVMHGGYCMQMGPTKRAIGTNPRSGAIPAAASR